MHRFLWILLAGLCLVAVACSPPAPVLPRIEHVLIISIDGLRPDVLLRANAPHLRKMMANGAFSMWARTTEVSITLPSHVSMLTGTIPEHHGIYWNYDVPDALLYPPLTATIFEVAKNAGRSTAMATGKSKFITLAKPGTLDYVALPTRATGGYLGDLDVAKNASRIILEHRPDLIFVHFPDVDATGHGIGWGMPEQVQAASKADSAVGIVLAALRRAGIEKTTAIIVSADHGGAARGHGPDDPRSRHIPWIITGPGVRKNVDLTRYNYLIINTEDTFATACYMLGLTPPGPIDGKPILQAFTNFHEPHEMLSEPVPAAAPESEPWTYDREGLPRGVTRQLLPTWERLRQHRSVFDDLADPSPTTAPDSLSPR